MMMVCRCGSIGVMKKTERYFELRNGALYYFRKKEDPKPAGCIPLQGCECVPEDGKHKNVFIITGPFARVYHVMGENPEDVKSWIGAIAKTVSSLSTVCCVSNRPTTLSSLLAIWGCGSMDLI
jgi:hypothetical protein